mmetsp:Transcript_142097/g.264839  ORF Transcript_142097/g.264839 Transcript_142097/m.264839 type:complete len:245 (-) Transcript_142097:1260-1994(-)
MLLLVRLFTFKGGNRLLVVSELLTRLLHELLILCLGVLFLSLDLDHLLVQVSDKQVQHGHHTGTRLLLGLVGRLVKSFKVGSQSDLRKAHAEILGDALCVREFGFRRWDVEIRLIEFAKTVLCNTDQFLGGPVARNDLLELGVFLLAEFCCLLHLFVQCFDSGNERGNFFLRGLDALLMVFDLCCQIRSFLVDLLEAVLRLLNVCLAHFLLLVIIALLIAKQFNHVINHRDDLPEIYLFALERQ